MAPNTQNPARGVSAILAAEAEVVFGERLIWAERAGPSSIALRAVPKALAGGIFLLAIPFFVIHEVQIHWGVQSLGGLVFCGLFISLFLSIGLIALLSPFHAAAQARKTVYAITDQRVFIISTFRRRRVDSYAPSSIDFLETTEGANGYGNIVFGKDWTPATTDTDDDGSNPKIYQSFKRVGFFGIPEVRKVEEAIRQLVAVMENPSAATSDIAK